LVLCFQHIQMLSDLNWIQKSFFHDSFPPKCGVLQFKFYWNYHWKQALFFHLFLLHKPEAFFHANRCHELSHSPIQLDALSIMKNSAFVCSFTLVFCTSQSDKKSLIRHHYHQVPFFGRIIVLFLTWNIKLRCQNDWNYLFSIHNIFIVGAIMLSISNSWNSIETKWYLVPFSIDTKDSIFKRKFQFKQQIFHCSKKFEMAKSRESSFQ